MFSWEAFLFGFNSDQCGGIGLTVSCTKLPFCFRFRKCLNLFIRVQVSFECMWPPWVWNFSTFFFKFFKNYFFIMYSAITKEGCFTAFCVCIYDAKKYTLCRWAQKWGVGRVQRLPERCWSADLLVGRRAALDWWLSTQTWFWGEMSFPTKSPYQEWSTMHW